MPSTSPLPFCRSVTGRPVASRQGSWWRLSICQRIGDRLHASQAMTVNESEKFKCGRYASPAGARCDPDHRDEAFVHDERQSTPAPMTGRGVWSRQAVRNRSPGRAAKFPSCFLAQKFERSVARERIHRASVKYAPLACALPAPSPAAGKTDWSVVIGNRLANSLTETSRPGATSIERLFSASCREFEKWLNRYGRFVVEQNDQLVAHMNERDLFVGDTREVDFDVLIVPEIDDDGLITKRFCQPEDAGCGCVGIGDSRARSLGNLKRSVHQNLSERKKAGVELNF